MLTLWRKFSSLTLFGILLSFYAFGRLASDFIFFGKSIDRRYYPNEFPSSYLLKHSFDFIYLKVSPYFYSYEGSKSLKNLRVVLTKENIYVDEKTHLTDQEMFYVMYERENYQKGAVEINMRSEIPSWTKTISFWVFDYESGNDMAIYIRSDKGIKKYFVSHLNYKGWRNFTVFLDSYTDTKKLVLDKIKFFNRKQKGGANDSLVVIKVSQIEVFSQIVEKRSLEPFFYSFGKEDFLEQKEGFFHYFRLKKGFAWKNNENLSLFLNCLEPFYLEIYGSLRVKKMLFALQTSFFEGKIDYRIDLKLPTDLSTQETYFWGFGIIPIENRDNQCSLKQVVIW